MRRFCHATRPAHVSAIMRDGLLASGSGRLSAGIYLTDDATAILCIARHRAAGGGADCVVIDVEADLGHIKDIGHGSDTAGTWRREGYDSCTSIHPPWEGSSEFREYCVADTARVRVIGNLRFYAWMTNGGGWSNPIYYETIHATPIDNKLYVFGRGETDIHLACFDTASNSWSFLPGLSWLGDAEGWNQPQHYKTIRVTCIGQKLFVFGRGCSDIHLASFDTTSNSWSFLPGLTWLADAGGWNAPQHHKTIRVTPIDNKLYVFGRGETDIHLACFDTVSNSWSFLPGLSWLGDAEGWNQPQHYKTIRVTCIGQKLFVFGRGCSDVHLASFDTTSNSWSFLPGLSWLGDSGGWNAPQHYETIRVRPIDNKLYVFARGETDIHLACFDTVSNSWSILPGLSWLGDAEGWNQPQYYQSIRVKPIGQKLIVFGRGCSDIHLASFDTTSNSWSFLSGFTRFGDADGWDAPQHYETMDVIPIGQNLYTFGRGSGHLHLQCSSIS